MKEFQLIYEEYYDQVLKYILKLTGGEYQTAEELTQETFYQAFTAIYRFNGRSSLYTWLCSIAKNCYYKEGRKRKDIPMDMHMLSQNLHCFQKDISETVELKAELEWLRDAIRKLEEKERNVLIMKGYLGYSFKEIGHMLHIRENTARVIYHRAKEKLKIMHELHG